MNIHPCLQDDAGNNIPIGLFEMAWESNSLLIHMAALMIREGLGFHAQVNPTVGGNGGSQVFALAGCTDFNDKANMECGTQETTIHVSVDSWIGSYASTQNQFAKEYPRLAAEDLGSMGYAGEESMYVSRAILQAAYSESGLALDFYKSYFACLSVFFLFKASRFSLKGATGFHFSQRRVGGLMAQ